MGHVEPKEDQPHKGEAKRKKQQMRERYEKLIGERAKFYNKDTGTKNVVIMEAAEHYVRLQYLNRLKQPMQICSMYFSLLCGDDKLDVMDVVEREIIVEPAA